MAESPNSPTSSHTHIVIDLGQKKVETALAILRQRKRRKKVASAVVRSKSSKYGRIAYDKSTSNQELFVRVFEALTDFPKLKKLSVEFEELETVTLPASCLLLVLAQPESRLKSLKFSNVRFKGDQTDITALAEAIRMQLSLTRVSFYRCAGETASLHPLLQAFSCVSTLKEVVLESTRIRTHDPYAQESVTWDGSSVIQLCQYPSQIRTLVLKDVPDIGNRLVREMAQSLATNKSKLKSLTLSSIRLGDSAGLGLMSMLEVNRHLTTLKLDFEFGLLTGGRAIADALATNVSLEHISLNLTASPGNSETRTTTSATANTTFSLSLSWSSTSSEGDLDDDYDDDEENDENSEQRRQRDIDAIDSKVGVLARALRDNTTLRHFHLCLDLDDYVAFEPEVDNALQNESAADGQNWMEDDSSTHNYFVPDGETAIGNNITNETQQEEESVPGTYIHDEDAYFRITQAFEDLLRDYNHTLHTLQVNDGVYEWKHFQARIEFYLKLNRAGIRPLLQKENATKEEWVHAMERQVDDINVLYYLLARNPSLCCDTFGHVRDEIVRDHSVSASIGGGRDQFSKEDKKEAKKLSWWKRGKHRRHKMLKRMEKAFSSRPAPSKPFGQR